jgi:DMSO reductase anchor subunit
MHPARSVILFTTLSGMGFGLLFWLGLGRPDVTGWVAFAFFAIAYALAVGGLLASTLHLGHPERAIKAFSQWRSSWLSREGVCAVAALVMMALYGAGLVFLETRWNILGWIGAILSLLTVFTTSMIYTQLKTVPRWNISLTPLLYLGYALAGGAILAAQITPALTLLPVVAAIQIAWWITGDTALRRSGTTLESATGLGNIGKVRAFEPPHTSPNYLMTEFMYIVGRKHATKLRVIAFGLAFVLPLVVLTFDVGHTLAAVAVLSHAIGVYVSRWLFFAQAEHVVGLYYGKR